MAAKANHPFAAMMSAVEKVDTPDPETAIGEICEATGLDHN
jgi:hypothetical protein